MIQSQVKLTQKQQMLLQQLAAEVSPSITLAWRVRVIMATAAGESRMAISRKLFLNPTTVLYWRRRWCQKQPHLTQLEQQLDDTALCEAICEALNAQMTAAQSALDAHFAAICELAMDRLRASRVHFWTLSSLRNAVWEAGVLPVSREDTAVSNLVRIAHWQAYTNYATKMQIPKAAKDPIRIPRRNSALSQPAQHANPFPISFPITQAQKCILEEILNNPICSNEIAVRVQIILQSAAGLSRREIASHYGVGKSTIGIWRNRWLTYQAESQARPKNSQEMRMEILELICGAHFTVRKTMIFASQESVALRG